MERRRGNEGQSMINSKLVNYYVYVYLNEVVDEGMKPLTIRCWNIMKKKKDCITHLHVHVHTMYNMYYMYMYTCCVYMVYVYMGMYMYIMYMCVSKE